MTATNIRRARRRFRAALAPLLLASAAQFYTTPTAWLGLQTHTAEPVVIGLAVMLLWYAAFVATLRTNVALALAQRPRLLEQPAPADWTAEQRRAVEAFERWRVEREPRPTTPAWSWELVA